MIPNSMSSRIVKLVRSAKFTSVELAAVSIEDCQVILAGN